MEAKVEFRILGPLEVLDADGNPVPLGPPRQHALLVALLLHRRSPLSVERLIDLLWGDAAPETAATVVHGSVAGLRRALEPRRRDHASGSLLVTRPTGYKIDVPDDRIDAIRFERLIAEARRHLRADPSRASATLSEALSLWRGTALAGLDGDFVRNAARRLEERRLDALEARIEADLALGRHHDVLGELDEAVVRHPLRERLWSLYLLALYRCGRQADALAAYRTVRRILGEELGLTPGPELRDLEQAILEQHPSLDAPGATRRRPRLPTPLDPFIGRRREIQELRSLLEAHRLVTLVGAAGIGKTRAALEIARSMADRFSAGAWFVDLAPLSTPALVAQTAADVLGVQAEPGVSITETVAAALASRDALVVLDNCEHLVRACADFAGAVATAGPGVRLLATSRERLGVPGEVVLSLPPLPVPEPDEPWERAATNEAVCLFAARAAAARPGFRVTEANVGLARDICRRLDGIPLALELAAARVGTLPLGSIAERLEDLTFALDHGAPEVGRGRHRGLAAAVEWSYGTLTEPAQLLFERLSVFAGGFTLEAAEAGGVGGQVRVRDVAPLLSQLVARSLVQLQHESPLDGRYRMLEPLRLYARTRLEGRQEARPAAYRHARHYLLRAEQIEPHLFAAGSKVWLERLRAESANLRAALEWLFGPDGDPQLGVRLAGLLWHVWDLSGARAEGLHWLRAGLRVVDRPEARMELLGPAALLHLGLAELEAARELSAEELDLARRVGDKRWEGDALTRLGTVAWATGDLGAAESCYRDAISALDDAGDPWRSAIAQVHLARVYRDSGELAKAKETAHQASVSSGIVNEDTVVGFALDILASIMHALGQSDSASALAEEALVRYRAVGYREGEASALHLAGTLLLARDALHPAAETFAAALELCRRMGHRAGIATNLEGLARVMGTAGQDRTAAALLGAARAQRDAIGLAQPAPERRASERESARLVERLGPNEMEEASRHGTEMSLDELLRTTTNWNPNNK
ncbi:MAG TPA: BTAD domain-containing putative transcriptional regulator [Acidimicrobiales bacterium]|nr:BTAD domain-containing putative transcriptional regulator [Acidimicrobiales bacterium]